MITHNNYYSHHIPAEIIKYQKLINKKLNIEEKIADLRKELEKVKASMNNNNNSDNNV